MERFETLFRICERGNQMILHAAGEGIYGVNAKGETTFLNPAAERMLGWRADELVGQTMHAVIHHSHRRHALQPQGLPDLCRLP